MVGGSGLRSEEAVCGVRGTVYKVFRAGLFSQVEYESVRRLDGRLVKNSEAIYLV